MGSSIQALVILCSEESTIPADFVFVPPPPNLAWHKSSFTVHPYKPDNLIITSGHHEIHDDPNVAVLVTTPHVLLLKLIRSYKKINIDNETDPEFLELKSIQNGPDMHYWINFLNNASHYTFSDYTKLNAQIFDTYEFMKSPIIYFRDFLISRGFTPNDKLSYYVGLVYAHNEAYITEYNLLESLAEDVINCVNKKIEIEPYQLVYVLSLVSRKLNIRFIQFDKPLINYNEVLNYVAEGQ